MNNKRRNTDHIKIANTPDGNHEISCDHCGARLVVTLPMELKLWTKQTNAFVQLHKDCKPSEEPIQETA